MRTLFLALVGCVALALVAGLLAPRLVDREALRQELRRIAVRSLGQDLTVRGPVAIDMFPRPRLIASRLSSGPSGDGNGESEIQIDRVRLEISPWALLLGRIVVQRIQLVRPLLRLDEQGLQRLGSALLAGTEHVAGLNIIKGTLETTGSPLSASRIENLDLDLVRSAETGSLSLNATAFVHDQPIRLVAQSGPLLGIAAAEGRVTLGRGDEALTGTFNGTIDTAAPLGTLSGKLRVETSELGLAPDLVGAVLGRADVLSLPTLGHAWFEAAVELDRTCISLDDIVAELPDASARGSVVVGFGPKPSLTADLKVDKARFKAGLESILGRAVRDELVPAMLTGTTGRLDLQAGSVTIRDAAVGNSRLALSWRGDGQAKIERAVARLPGGTEIVFQGATSVEDGWHGPLEIAGDDIRTTLSWMGLPFEGMPPAGLSSAHGTLNLDVVHGRTIVEAKDFLLDTTTLGGRLALVDGERPKLAIVGKADRIDLGNYLAKEDGRPAIGPLQNLARDIDVAMEVGFDRLVWQRLQANGVTLHGETDHGRFRLDELQVDQLGGMRARLVGDGSIDGSHYGLAVEASAPRPSRLLRAMGLRPPLGLDQLGAARLAGTARRTPQGSDLDLALTTPGLELAVIGDPSPDAMHLTLTATAANLSSVIEALGGRTVAPGSAAIPLRASGALHREGDAYTLGAEAVIAETDLELDLRLQPGKGPPRVEGNLTLDNLDPALVAVAGDVLADAAALPPPGSWVGDWPRSPLPWHHLDTVALDLALTASLVGDEAQMSAVGAKVQLSDGHLALHDLDLPLAGGRLRGVVTFDATPEGSGVLGADLILSRTRAELLLPAPAQTHGDLDVDLSVASAGWSAADLIGNLEGRGRARLRHGGVGDDAILEQLLLIDGPLQLDRGIMETPAPGLSLRFPGGEGSVRLSTDLLAWVGKIRTEAFSFEAPDKVTTQEAVGPIGRMRAVSKNFAASAP